MAALRAFLEPKPRPLMRPRPLGSSTGQEGSLLAGRNVLVTGAGQNIGRSIALEMAKQGAHIYFTDIDAGKISLLQKELSSFSSGPRGFLSDITTKEDTDLLCRSLKEEEIIIDILVNNVGVRLGPPKVKDVDIEILRKTLETNITGPLYLTKQIVGTIIEQKIQASVIFVSSIHEWLVIRDISYSTSKAAVGMMIKELAVDLAPYGIRVNGIAPGAVAEDKNPVQTYNQYIPLYSAPIDPVYIGRAAVFLASEFYSARTTGSVLTVDSGLSLFNHSVDQRPPGI